MYFMKSKWDSLWNQHWLHNDHIVSLKMDYYQEHSLQNFAGFFPRIAEKIFQSNRKELRKEGRTVGRKEVVVDFSYLNAVHFCLVHVSFESVCLQRMLKRILRDKFYWISHRCISGQLFRRLEVSSTSDYFIALSVLKFLGNVCVIWSRACSLQSQRLLSSKVTQSSVYKTNNFF